MENIAELRKIQINLLNSLTTICEKYSLKYWIDFGTLLGAKRDGKFIAWDDDIDVSMPLTDYHKFIEVAKRELPNDVFIQTPQTDPAYRQAFVKLRDCNSTFVEHHEEIGMPYHQGIYLDIFPMYEYPAMPTIPRKILQRLTCRSRESIFVRRKNLLINFPTYIICRAIWGLLKFLPSRALGMTPEDNGYMYVTQLKDVYPLSKIYFEDSLYSCPKNIDAHLTSLYGEGYMTPPPVEKRVPHAKLILINSPPKITPKK